MAVLAQSAHSAAVGRLTVLAPVPAFVHHDRLITGVAAALAGSAVLLTMVGIVYNPAIIAVALAFGAAAYFMWYQASGRLASRVYRSVEQQAARNNGEQHRRTADTGRGGFGAGPREDWTPPRDDQRRRARAGARGSARQRGNQQQQRRAPSTTDRPTREEAFRTLGLSPGADEATVKQAYRNRVKDVHPDNGGSESEFKRVKRAYERLT